MAIISDIHFPGVALAYREYPVTLRNGSRGIIAFTLGDGHVETVAAQVARDRGAAAYGLVSMRDVPDAPQHPFVWMHDWKDLSLAVEGDCEISNELETIIFLYIAMFFEEMAPLAPHLSVGLLSGPASNDNLLH